MDKQKHLKYLASLLLSLISITACDRDVNDSTNTLPISAAVSVQEKTKEQAWPVIENKSYLFDVSNHSIEELEALLIRAEEVSQTHPADFDDLEIVMILHGPDIDWFTQQNYEHNQKLIDLAARLDAYDVIDMKVCEATMQKRGVIQEDLPGFIESVPYAPTEIKYRLQNDYINL